MVKGIFSGVLKISFDCHLELLHYNNDNDINTHVSNGPTSDGTHNSDLFHSWNRGIVRYQWASKMFTNTECELNVKKRVLFRLSPKDS